MGACAILAGALVVNVGANLECWTNGRWGTSVHRVNMPGVRRARAGVGTCSSGSGASDENEASSKESDCGVDDAEEVWNSRARL
jgi:hypothetical protein